MINGVAVHPLRQIVDERGKIMHMLRRDDPAFQEFGEIYFSTINPGVVKAWHGHRQMVLNYVCIFGLIKLVLYDARQDSRTRGEVQEIYLGPDNYILVTIPAEVINGFKGVAVTPSIVANCATLPHDPEEIYRIDPFDNDIPYDWSLRHG